VISDALLGCESGPSGVSKVLNNLRLTADLQGFYHDGTSFPATVVSSGPLVNGGEKT
jgi:hypothetical protein